ncbi:MAG: hypothetical protein L0228_00980 [Planctomycetes bacterium]|nr:hypothetical protein [Planctomycetota bacterium]
MRHSMRALLGVMLVGWSCCQAMATEAGSKWWPFGQRRDAEVARLPYAAPSAATSAPSMPGEQPSLPQYPTAEVPERRWMINSPLAKVSWPRVHMPELPKFQMPPSPWPKKSEIDAARNSWVERSPDPLKPSPLQAVTDGARRVGQSTRRAWDKTVDAITPGDRSQPNSSRIARREDRPSIWKRMFGADDPRQVEGPQTITEWMAQDRIDP